MTKDEDQTTKKSEASVHVKCPECGNGYRDHWILHEHKTPRGNSYEGWTHDEYDQFLRCKGCGGFKYRHFSLGPEHTEDDDRTFVPYDEMLYPDISGLNSKRKVLTFTDDGRDLVPESVSKMYRETIDTFNAGARTLAGGGLRATVEAICLTQGLDSGSLQKKIDELAVRGLLTKSQADLLHEERYLGNAALHELSTPSLQDIEDGLMIVEGLMNAIYVLPAKASRLRKGREDAAKQKSPSDKDV